MAVEEPLPSPTSTGAGWTPFILQKEPAGGTGTLEAAPPTLPPDARSGPGPGAPGSAPVPPGSPSASRRALRQALQRAAEWERLHPPTVPRPVLTASVALHSLADREA